MCNMIASLNADQTGCRLLHFKVPPPGCMINSKELPSRVLSIESPTHFYRPTGGGSRKDPCACSRQDSSGPSSGLRPTICPKSNRKNYSLLATQSSQSKAAKSNRGRLCGGCQFASDLLFDRKLCEAERSSVI